MKWMMMMSPMMIIGKHGYHYLSYDIYDNNTKCISRIISKLFYDAILEYKKIDFNNDNLTICYINYIYINIH